jgi:hypothetical protein
MILALSSEDPQHNFRMHGNEKITEDEMGYNSNQRPNARKEIDNDDSSYNADTTNQNQWQGHPPHGEIPIESLPFFTQQQIEEERLRGDILRYLVKNSNGTYHYSAELRAIIHDVIGIPFKASQTEFQETVTSLLDILHSDPQRLGIVLGLGLDLLLEFMLRLELGFMLCVDVKRVRDSRSLSLFIFIFT